ncbi:MAG: hypothetical protein U0174_15655 [Polyangiaceae bacterium]
MKQGSSRAKRIVGIALMAPFPIAVACHAPEASTPSGPDTSASASPAATALVIATAKTAATNGPSPHRTSGTKATCSASSVRQNTKCPIRPVPASTASSPEGCKSDAECTQGKDGRCVRMWGEGPTGSLSTDGRNANLMAGPPLPPPRTQCVYDTCQADGDCAPNERCSCGSGKGKERNTCIRVDQCLSDNDCPQDYLCACAGAGRPNMCVPGNCRSDADCAGNFKCETYCHSAADKCVAHSDCTAAPHMIAICKYVAQEHAWGCTNMVPRPPG